MHGSLEHLKIEIDLLAPGAERIVGRNPPLDIIARDIIFGEGPVWDARGKQLYFTDIIGDTVWKWKPGVGQEIVMRPSVNACGPCARPRATRSARRKRNIRHDQQQEFDDGFMVAA